MSLPQFRAVALSALGCALLAIVVLLTGPDQILALLSKLGPGPLAICMGLIAASSLLGGLNLFLLLDRERRPPIQRFLPVYWLAWAVGLIFPAQVGDLVVLSTALKRHGMNISFTLGNALLDKLISLAVIACFGVAGVAHTAGIHWVGSVLALITAAGLAWIARGAINRLPWGRRLNSIRTGRLAAVIATLSEAAATIRGRPGRVALNAAVSLVKVLITGTGYWVLLRAFGLEDAGPLAVTAIAMAAGLVAYLPVSLNGMGTVEAAGILLFRALDADPATVVATYLVLRLSGLLMAWVPSILWLSCLSAERALRGKR